MPAAVLPENEERRAGKRPRTRPQFEEVDLRQKTYSVTNPQGYDDSEAALVFDVPSNGGYHVETQPIPNLARKGKQRTNDRQEGGGLGCGVSRSIRSSRSSASTTVLIP
jgi:hypothetical protein